MIQNEEKIKQLIMSECEKNHNLGMILLCSHEEIDIDIFSRIIFECIWEIITQSFDSCKSKLYYSDMFKEWVYKFNMSLKLPFVEIEIRIMSTSKNGDNYDFCDGGILYHNGRCTHFIRFPTLSLCINKSIISEYDLRSEIIKTINSNFCSILKQYTS